MKYSKTPKVYSLSFFRLLATRRMGPPTLRGSVNEVWGEGVRSTSSFPPYSHPPHPHPHQAAMGRGVGLRPIHGGPSFSAMTIKTEIQKHYKCFIHSLLVLRTLVIHRRNKEKKTVSALPRRYGQGTYSVEHNLCRARQTVFRGAAPLPTSLRSHEDRSD